MRVDGLTLLIPEKHDVERAAVAAAWEGAGGAVLALGRFWEPPALDPARVRCYGNDTFCLVLAQKLGLELVSPPDDYLGQLSPDLLKRSVGFVPLGAALAGPFPSFVKPAVPKQFGARVFRDSAELAEETRGLPPETTVIVAEVVEIDAEVRSFVLDDDLRAYSVYEGEVGEELLRDWIGLQRDAPVRGPMVIDWAYIRDRGWAVLEANAAWGAGLNGCDAAAVLPCIERASRHA